MTLLFLLACAGDPQPMDSGSTDDGTADTGTAADTDTDGGGDSGDTTAGLPPGISVDLHVLGAEVGGELSFTVTVDDEDPGGVVLAAEAGEALVDGGFDGATWTGTATTHGVTTLTVTATDAGGQVDSLELPLHVWVGRDWSGLLPMQSPDEDFPSPCITLSQDGWTYVAGWAGPVGMVMAMGVGGMEWAQSFVGDTEYGHCSALDESNGHVLYVADRYPAARGVVRSVDASGTVWESDAPFQNTTAYWVDAGDGLAAVAGTYSDSDTDTRGGWVQLYDSATGDLVDDPILLGATATSVRTEPSALQLLDDGSVLAGSWGYWDWDSDSSATSYSGWIQLAGSGDVAPEPLIVLSADDGDVFLADAMQLSDGRIAVTGLTSGSLYATSVSDSEGFLAVYESDGSLAWSVQYQGRSTSRFLDLAEGYDGRLYVAADAGYLAGWVGVLAYEADGTELWETTALEGVHSLARGVAARGDDLVLTGAFQGNLTDPPVANQGGIDGFILRLDTDGEIQD